MGEKHDGFVYEFTMREFFYFMFCKKKCPNCNGELEKKKDYETVKGTNFSKRSVVYLKQRVKHYIYKFTCKQCGSQYTLEELAKRRE